MAEEQEGKNRKDSPGQRYREKSRKLTEEREPRQSYQYTPRKFQIGLPLELEQIFAIIVAVLLLAAFIYLVFFVFRPVICRDVSGIGSLRFICPG